MSDVRPTQTFGSWLRDQRKARDLTQDALARRAGCAVITLQKLEADTRRPSRAMVEALARALDIAPGQFNSLVRFARFGQTPPAPPNNLPAPVTRFIGRAALVAALRAQLQCRDVHLLTLCGPPGIGKTRLALQVAAECLGFFDGGVFFVALASIAEPALVIPTIAKVIGASAAAPSPSTEMLGDYLMDREALLVLDNFEQVAGATPHVVALLARCPLLKIIVTSRVALRVRAERRIVVPPLPAPDPETILSAGALEGYAAAELFVDRAQAVRADFVVTDANAPVIAAICRRLDGLPLAIELVAARTQLLSSEQIVARLSGRFLLEDDALVDGDERQRTLASAIRWSYDLLPGEEQSLLAELAVFAGGCVLEAARAVATAAEEDLLERLTSLANNSLVVVQPVRDAPRFTLLEIVREFGLDQLRAAGRLDALRLRHAAYYATGRDPRERPLPHSEAVLDQLEQERDNIRAALEWSVAEGEADLAACLALDLATLSSVRGRYLSESRAWLRRVLALPGLSRVPNSLVAQLYDAAGMLAFLQSDFAAARPLLEQGLTIARASGSPARISRSLHSLSNLCLVERDLDAAAGLLAECLRLARQLDDHWLTAMALYNLSELARRAGRCPEAEECLAEAIRLLTAAEDRAFLPLLLASAGALAEERADDAAADALYRDALRRAYAMGDLRLVASCLENLAGLALRLGCGERSAELLGAADALRTRIGASPEPASQVALDRLVERGQAALGPGAFWLAFTRGSGSDLADVVCAALE